MKPAHYLTRTPALRVVLCASLLVPAFLAIAAANGQQDADVSQKTAAAVPAAVVLLKTQDFESGEKTMPEASAESLEAFLQDLNQRKDWDYACHNGQPGPDAAYLFKWVVRTTCELERRGYYFDADKQLRRPGTVVPVR